MFAACVRVRFLCYLKLRLFYYHDICMCHAEGGRYITVWLFNLTDRGCFGVYIIHTCMSSSSPWSGWVSFHLICSALLTCRLHPSQSSAITSHSRLFTSIRPRSLLTLSLHLNFGILLLLLPPSSVSMLSFSIGLCQCIYLYMPL